MIPLGVRPRRAVLAYLSSFALAVAACNGLVGIGDLPSYPADGGDSGLFTDTDATIERLDSSATDGALDASDPSCPSGATRCGSLCLDTTSDPLHCGGCDAACGENMVCQASVCACAQGFHLCGGVCSSNLSPYSCGPTSCTPCGTPLNGTSNTCTDAGCGTCPPTLTLCNANTPSAACVDLAGDPNHCGDCSTVCPLSDAGATCTGDPPTCHQEADLTDASVCLGGIGCPCGATAECESSAFCADKEIVSGSSVGNSGTGDAGNGDSAAGVCTKACCASTDCDTGSVCFATGMGGNYCVPAAAIGDRATTGTLDAPGGQMCEAGATCRSGLCASSGLCADTCCATGLPVRGPLPSQCAIGTSCSFGDVQGLARDTAYVPRCAPPVGSAANGTPCTSNSDCRSNFCLNDSTFGPTCHDPCRRPEDCVSLMLQTSQTCQYVQLGGPGNGLAAICVPLATSDSGPFGTVGDWGPCNTSLDCGRGYCAPSGDGPSVCVSVCFGDGDCVSSETCRPQTLEVGGTIYNVLACR